MDKMLSIRNVEIWQHFGGLDSFVVHMWFKASTAGAFLVQLKIVVRNHDILRFVIISEFIII